MALLPPGSDEAARVAAARERGIALSGLAEHSVAPRRPALLLGYGRIAEAAIAAGVEELAAGTLPPDAHVEEEAQLELRDRHLGAWTRGSGA